MGELYGRWSRALDSNLGILTTAKLYTFDSVATTTPKTTYSDAGLTTPHLNPVPAGPDGRFPQIFADDGSGFYLVLRSNTTGLGGLIIDTFSDVQALGSAVAGTLARDFGLGGKWQVRGDSGAGMAHLEFGDPEPDVLGGAGRIGGWADSQGDSLSLDFLEVNATGDITERGKNLQGVVYTPRTAFTTVTSIPIALPNEPTGVQAWRIDIFGVNSLSSVTLTGTMSIDGGGTYKTGGSDYTFTGFTAGSAAAATTANDTGDPAMKFNPTEAMNNGAWWLTLDIYTAADVLSAFPTMVSGVLRALGTTAQNIVLSQNTFLASFGRPDHVKLILSTGTATGFYRVAPQRGYGTD